MKADLILAIDQGTTNTKAILVNIAGQVVARGSRSPGVSYPQPAWVEQDPLELWETVRGAIDDCLAAAGDPPLAAVAISNQRETTIAWERRTGKPLGPAVVWQCHRSADFCHELSERGLEPLLRTHTGLTIDPMFSGSKMRWLLDHIPYGHARAAAGEICLGTVDAWVLWNLTQPSINSASAANSAVFACDRTNASRTQLFNLKLLEWDLELLEIFGIPRPALPLACPSAGIFGVTRSIGRLPAGVPIAALVGDSHAALYGHAGFQPGAVKATYGTGSSLMTAVESPVISAAGLSTTIAWSTQEDRAVYALEGNIYVTGAVVQWLGQLIGKPHLSQEIEALAREAADNQGVYIVPAFTGLGAPHWSAEARGLICGLTRGAGPAQLARAALESIAYQVNDVLQVMDAESGRPPEILLTDGGASRNHLLMQFQADISGRPVIRNLSTEVSALGAAYLAGLACGLWAGEDEIAALPRPQERFEPNLAAADRERLLSGWRDALDRTLLSR